MLGALRGASRRVAAAPARLARGARGLSQPPASSWPGSGAARSAMGRSATGGARVTPGGGLHGAQRAAFTASRSKSSLAQMQAQADEESGGGEQPAVVVAPAAPAASVLAAAATPAHSSGGAEAPPGAPAGARAPGGGGSDTAVGLEGLDGVGLSDRMRERLAQCGITGLFPVQRATFAALMNGKDMLVKARTGSGKTIGFALPIIEKIMAARGGEQRGRRGRAPASVILAPTRELALQIQREFLRIDRAVTATCVYGGAPSGPQERALREGVDVVVGTPGRVIDMLERGALRMEEVKVFVLDEADEMLKMGFQEDVERIMQGLPEERQMNLWSATQPRWITQTARKYCNNLETMDMVGSNPVRTADTIRHLAAATSWEHQGLVVANMVRAHANGKRTLVFCNTKMDVEAMAASSELKGMARVIHGDVNQQQRERTLADFRAGLFNVLVATDVAARGIDVPEVALVVQTKVMPRLGCPCLLCAIFPLPSASVSRTLGLAAPSPCVSLLPISCKQIPDDEDTFVHRSGRTGRAGREGINAVLYRAGEEGKLLQLAKTIGIDFALEGSPTEEQMMQSRKEELSGVLDAVPAQSMDAFKDLAMEMHEARGWQALASALASLAGFNEGGPLSCSMLAGRADYVTVQIEMSPKVARNLRGIPGLKHLLQTAYPEANFTMLGKMVRLKDGVTVLVDVPSREFAKLAQKAAGPDDAQKIDAQKIVSESEPGVAMFAAKKLPSLKDLVSVMRQDTGGGRGRRGGAGGGGYPGYSGGHRQRDYGHGGGGGFGDRGRQRNSGGGAYADGGNYGRGHRGGSRSGGGGGGRGGHDEWVDRKGGYGGGYGGGNGWHGGGGGGRRSERPPKHSEWGR